MIQTTTLSILTAEFPPSDGEVRLGGYDISQNPDVVRRLVGYCPQFDALVSQPSRFWRGLHLCFAFWQDGLVLSASVLLKAWHAFSSGCCSSTC